MKTKTPLAAILAMACAVVLLATEIALAQNLTRAQEGRVEAAKCWAQCQSQYQADRHAGQAYGQWYLNLLVTIDPSDFSDGGRAILNAGAELLCSVAQETVRTMDACYQSCTDIERAYGNPSNLAKSRFRHVFLEERNDLRAAGLWDNYNNSPDDTAAFDRACNRWLDSASAGYPRIGRAALGLGRAALSLAANKPEARTPVKPQPTVR